MIIQALKIFAARDIGDQIGKVEKTETGKFALGLAKGTVILVLGVVGIAVFFTVRSMNKTFGKQKNEIAGIRNQLIGMSNAKPKTDEPN